MPRTSHRHGLVIVPADACLSRDSQTTMADSVTVNSLRLSDDKNVKQLLPLFVLSEAGVPKMIVEIARFSHPFGSWLIVPEDVNLVPEVCSNGNMTLVTRVDPLFAALAVMDSSRKVTGNDVFQPLEAMCITADGINLARLCDAEQFTLICDVKEAAGDRYYRLKDEKVTKWLARKHANLMKHPHVNHESAIQIVSQYVTKTWERLLLNSLDSSLKADAPGITVPQKGEDLAMAIMMEDAKETNRAKRLIQTTSNAKSFKAKRIKTNTPKKARPQSAAVGKFWSSVKSKQTSSR